MVSAFINLEQFPKTRKFEYQAYNDFTSFSNSVVQMKAYSVQKTGTWIDDNWFKNHINANHYNTYAIFYTDSFLIDQTAL